MFDSITERLEEYYDYITETNQAISSGIDTIKNIFGGVVNKYRN